MEKVIELLATKWPHLLYFLAVTIGAIAVFRFAVRHYLDEYRALLSQYKGRNEFMLEEIKALQNSKKELTERVAFLEAALSKTENKLRLFKIEFESVERKHEDALTLIKEAVLDTKRETQALFAERDRHDHDIELAWKALHRISVVEPEIEKAVHKAYSEVKRMQKKAQPGNPA